MLLDSNIFSMNNLEDAENKLLLLYLIDKIEFPLSNLQITQIILDNKFMNYFYLQQYIKELCDSKFLITNSENNKIYYIITENGKQTLQYFENRISEETRNQIKKILQKTIKSIKHETKIVSDFTPINENEYIVNCKISENDFTLIDLNIMVGTKNDARKICENWKTNSSMIYPEIINSLIKER